MNVGYKVRVICNPTNNELFLIPFDNIELPMNISSHFIISLRFFDVLWMVMAKLISLPKASSSVSPSISTSENKNEVLPSTSSWNHAGEWVYDGVPLEESPQIQKEVVSLCSTKKGRVYFCNSIAMYTFDYHEVQKNVDSAECNDSKATKQIVTAQLVVNFQDRSFPPYQNDMNSPVRIVVNDSNTILCLLISGNIHFWNIEKSQWFSDYYNPSLSARQVSITDILFIEERLFILVYDSKVTGCVREIFPIDYNNSVLFAEQRFRTIVPQLFSHVQTLPTHVTSFTGHKTQRDNLVFYLFGDVFDPFHIIRVNGTFPSS
jgi:hypothetical protein